MKASEFMESSLGLVGGDRKDAYGADPMPGLARIATLWNGHLTIAGKAPAKPLDEADVAWMMADLKHARAHTGPLQIDNFVDGIGWVALAGEASMRLRGAYIKPDGDAV